MNLEKDIVREIKKLIVFTAIIFLCIWKYEVAFRSIHWILDVITPFLIGGAIAFIIGIPASYIEDVYKRQPLYYEDYKDMKTTEIASTVHDLSLIHIF